MTLRQLDWMADARDRAEWKRASWIMAVAAAPNRKDHRVRPKAYDPYELAKKPPMVPGELPKTVTNEDAEARYQEWKKQCQEQEQ